jgi:alditol oxidase
MTAGRTNWAGNVTFRAAQLHRPSSVGELRRVVAHSSHIRALGTGHSFNRLADGPGDQVSVAGLPPVLAIDPERAAVTVSAGLRYGEVASWLNERGWALRNLGSLPHISVAGAVATGTHGSGDRNGNLATSVAAMELVTADGDLVRVSRGSGDFAGMVVGLGLLGIASTVTLDIVPSFRLRQYVYDGLPREQRAEHFDQIFASGYSVSLFTPWQDDGLSQVWLKEVAGDGSDTGLPSLRWMDATLADAPRHPLPGIDPGPCTEQLGVPGPWHLRLPHFRLDFTPSSGDELQSEYLLPREHAIAALDAVDGIRHLVAPVLQISEIRTVAADGLWLSPSYQRPTVALHFTWISDAGAVAPAVAAVEEALAPLQARPHWGKVFSTGPAATAALYERMPDFRQLRQRWDPAGKFANELVDCYVLAGG